MEKINIAELLKDCPTGMELDCTVFDNVTFDKVSDDKKSINPIFCHITDEKGNRSGISFTKNGYLSRRYGAKCVIFPKGKTTWEGFQKPFKDGDILANVFGGIVIYKSKMKSNKNFVDYYCGYRPSDNAFIIKEDKYSHFGHINNSYYATEEEKQKLFDAIKASGYKWNAETKTLEKLPKFRVGNIVQDKTGYKVRITEVSIEDECYGYESLIVNGIGGIPFNRQDDWELIPNKFDITTLKPFESRVLVRSSYGDIWSPAIYGFTDSDRYYVVGGVYWTQCIPYEANKELLGTTNDCDEFYKTW